MAEAPTKPSGTFAQELEQTSATSLGSTEGTTHKVELFVNGASIGWLGADGSQWCVVTDAASALTLETYVYGGVVYYRNAQDTSRYLSVSDGYHYVGLYNWVGARGWTLTGDVLKSQYTGQQLSIYSTDNGYVYANDSYTKVTVQFR